MKLSEYFAALSFRDTFIETVGSDCSLKPSGFSPALHEVRFYSNHKVVHFDRFIHAVFYNGKIIHEGAYTLGDVKSLVKMANKCK